MSSLSSMEKSSVALDKEAMAKAHDATKVFKTACYMSPQV